MSRFHSDFNSPRKNVSCVGVISSGDAPQDAARHVNEHIRDGQNLEKLVEHRVGLFGEEKQDGAAVDEDSGNHEDQNENVRRSPFHRLRNATWVFFYAILTNPSILFAFCFYHILYHRFHPGLKLKFVTLVHFVAKSLHGRGETLWLSQTFAA